jgi:hypothetical protein
MVLQQFLVEKQTAFMPQPPYLANLAPYDFWLLPRPTMPATLKNIKCSATISLCTTPKEAFQECFQTW